VRDGWGRLDTLVNVVGGTFKAPFTEQSPRAWDALVRTNFTHVLHTSSRGIPLMRAGGRGGSIVNITTIECHRAAPNFAVYSAAKAAVTQFARTLAVELAPDGIRVNNVAPDITPTPNMMGLSGTVGNEQGFDPLDVSVSVPMGRLGKPTDVSNAVVFLASDLASYITGTTLHPDGGTFASGGWFNWPGDGFGNMLPPAVLELLHERDEERGER
jgi:3-oxoacyl-[acyl-carrier protein] reductase